MGVATFYIWLIKRTKQTDPSLLFINIIEEICERPVELVILEARASTDEMSPVNWCA